MSVDLTQPLNAAYGAAVAPVCPKGTDSATAMVLVPAQEWKQLCEMVRWIAGRLELTDDDDARSGAGSPDVEIGEILPAMPPGLRSRQSVIKGIKSGSLPGYKVGNRWVAGRKAIVEAAHRPGVTVIKQNQQKLADATHAESVASVEAFLASKSRRGKAAAKSSKSTAEK